MSRMNITGVTVSVEFGFDQDYGKGTKSFMNLSARVPEGETIPVDQAQEAIASGLDMYLTAWETLMGARLATGIVSAEAFNHDVAAVRKRIEKVKKVLLEP